MPEGTDVFWHFGGIMPFARRFDILHSPDAVFLTGPYGKRVVTVHDLAIFKVQNRISGYTTAAFRDKRTE